MTSVAPQHTPLTGKQIATRIALAATIVFILGMWLYAFVFATDSAAAEVADRAWSQRAEDICQRRNDVLDANAKHIRATTDGSAEAVGRGVSKATDIIETALDEVLAVQPASVHDQKLVAEWNRIYRIYIADRRATEKKLAAGEKAELNETMLNEAPVSASIADFTKVNRMDACSAPTGS